MPKPSLKVNINPEIIKWAIESSGWTINEISKRLKVNPILINGWLNANEQPSLYQIKNLSRALKRPLAAFFLPKPPKEIPLPQDFRMFPEKSMLFSKETLLTIRRARRLQSISKELSENLSIDILPNIKKIDLSTNPEVIAFQERKNFGIKIEDQFNWKDSSEAFKIFKKLIEDKNILVFQSSIPMKDARGFSLVDEYPFVIMINLKDSIEARNFTLFHEYAHILLNESGVCIPERHIISEGKGTEIEKWCNEFAASFLIPKEEIKKDIENISKNRLIENENISKFSHKYKISKSAFLLRILKLDIISQKNYEVKVAELKMLNRIPKGGGFPMPDKKCINEKGQKFISLVFKNFDSGKITTNDVLDYLSVKLKYLNDIRNIINIK